MKNIFKKILLICAFFVLCTTVCFAEGETKSTIEVDVHIGEIENFKPATAKMVLYNKNRLSIQTLDLEIDKVNVVKTLTFDVGEYEDGEEFYLSCLNDVDCIKYEEEYYGVNSKILLKTYSDYQNENSEAVKGNKFFMTLYPIEQQIINVYHNSRKYKTDYQIALVDGNCMISLVDVMNIFDLWDGKTVFNSETGKLEINLDDNNVVMTLGKLEASGKEAVTLPTAPTRINNLMYVPLRFTCEALGAEVEAYSEYKKLDVDIITTAKNLRQKEEFINSQNMSSRTNYLIWIDKSDFRVTVFKGSKNNWKAQNTYPCSIGAPNTPTITGVFEYYSKEKRWSYPKYYCGPVMRFHGGYAMHSTLVKYDGTFYDGRLEKMISLGCIRMDPKDIQYLWDTIPLYTRIYVTE